MVAGTRVNDADCSDAARLTNQRIVGRPRLQQRPSLPQLHNDLLRTHRPQNVLIIQKLYRFSITTILPHHRKEPNKYSIKSFLGFCKMVREKIKFSDTLYSLCLDEFFHLTNKR